VARRALTVCAEPGCPTLVEQGRCPQHERDAVRRRQQRRTRTRGNDPRTIKTVLRRDDYACTRCGAEKGDESLRKPGTRLRLVVHHVEAVEDGGSDDLGNLVTLCDDCHHAVHHGA
jgi:5-methylcytosine-specific restriction protein A